MNAADILLPRAQSQNRSRTGSGCVRAYDLARLTADLASSFRAAVEKAGMQLEIDCPELPEPVYVDREMWEKVVLNLLSNAFKFTFDGVIRVALRPAGDLVELVVSDTGTGIPENELPYVFARFHRVKGARGRTHEGTGIGLALVQEIVKQHGGTIRAESKLGEGSAFTVAIPWGRAHLPAERIGAARTVVSTAIRPEAYVDEAVHRSLEQPDFQLRTSVKVEGTVFIAEDNADMRDYLTRLLAQRYHVEAFADGAAALEAVRAKPPDLLLTDVMMPRMDGFELLKIIRADEKLGEVRVILLSARAGEGSKVEGLEAGADDYLIKPFTTSELLARVRSHLQMARSRKEAEQSLRQAQKLESIGLLAGGIAHDFNNLLVGVLGNASLILDTLQPDNPNYALAEDIIRASQTAANLTRQLLAYAGKGQFLTQRLDLSKLVREIKPLLQVSIPKEVELDLNLDPNVPAVEADATQMQQLIMNLVINGAEAIGEHRPGTVRISTSSLSDQVFIEVSDSGSGMTEEVMAKIFDPFFTTKFTGRGLGLAAAHGIVRAHHGSIQVKSAAGAGTTFLIAIPAVELAAEKDTVAMKPQDVRGSATILVVDDEKVVRTVARTALERNGYEVLLAENGCVAIEVFAQNAARISLVVLDWAMPLMNGEETLRRLKSIRADVPVLLSSGYNQSEAAEHFGSELAGFIQKPYKASELALKIKEALQIHLTARLSRFLHGG